MALGFSFSYDFLVKTQCHKLNSRFKNYASKASRQKFKNPINDILGKSNKERQASKQAPPIRYNTNRHYTNANASSIFKEDLLGNRK